MGGRGLGVAGPVVALAAVALLAAALVQRQARGADEAGGVLVRVNGPVRVAAGERPETVVVVNDSAVVEGTVAGQLVVVNGGARVSGTVAGDAVLINSRLTLEPGSRIGRDVMLFRGALAAAPGAEVGGRVQRRAAPVLTARFLFWLWFTTTLAVIISGVAFAALAARQFWGAAALLVERAGPTALTALITWVGLPLLAVVAFTTVIGIPLGFAIFLLIMPVLWFLGYLVAGGTLGRALLGIGGRRAGVERPLPAVVLGLVLLQVIAIIPVLGGLVAILAGLLGAGALVYRIRYLRRPPAEERAEPPRAAA